MSAKWLSFGADARVIEAGRHRMRAQHLAVVVLHQIAAKAVQHTDGCVAGNRRGMLVRVHTMPARFHAHQAHARCFFDIRIK